MLALVKPQFEAGREQVGKGGIVKEAATQTSVLMKVSAAACQLGFQIKGVTHSAIPGADGNIEFFMWLGYDPGAAMHAPVSGTGGTDRDRSPRRIKNGSSRSLNSNGRLIILHIWNQ